MFSYSKLLNLIAFAVIATVMIGCSGDSVKKGADLLTCDAPLVVNSSGDACVDPVAFECTLPTVPNAFNDGCEVAFDPSQPTPSVFPADDEAILYYNRANRGATNAPDDPQYNGYVLHTWNTPGGCDAYAPPFDQSDWGSTQVFDGIDPNYGAYWLIKLKEGYSDCGNFIIHIGTDDAGKEMGGSDKQMNLVQDDETFVRMNFTISGYNDLLEFPLTDLGPQPLKIENAAAHWIDTNTFVWDMDVALATEVRLHHSSTAGIEADLDNQVNGTAVVITSIDQTEAQQAAYPLTAGWAAFSIDATADEVKAIVKNELVIAAYNDDGAYLATHVQAGKVLDDLYTKGEADADEATLGVIYEGDAITANLWAPTAQNVMLSIYDASKTLVSSEQMTEDPATGIWSFVGDASLDRQFYRYDLTVYHSQNKAVESIWSTDPYSVSLSTNGRYSQFVNLDDADLKPEGWDDHTVPTIVDPEDAVIYEGHIRDFSVRDESTSEANRGKYLAFTEAGSAPMAHLADMTSSGLTHFHMLPANDIATINEDASEVININSTIAELCEANEDAPVCGVASDSDTILSVLESYQPASEDAQALVESMRGLDSFNWGYDPQHFNVPEGSYSSDADGAARILEMRAMNKALHDTGLRVVLDVVYNHTSSAGLWDNSVLDKVVPGYYHRRDLTSGAVENSTCCQDTELDHRMMDKFMADSLVQWTTQYGFDGFRFDIMSQGSREQMLAARDAVRAVDPDNYFYGEGWYKDNGRTDVQANQDNMAGTEISTFNDRLRDSVRDASLFNGDPDSLGRHDIVRLGMAGTLADYVLKGSSGTVSTGSSFNPSAYAADPADVINYVSKHDDPSLWDQLQFNLPFATSLEDRVRTANISIAIPLMSQGIPFLQIGGDMLRSKSMDRNSYDSGDWFNLVDFTMDSNNWNVGLPLASDNESRWYTDPDSDDLSISALANSPLTQVSSSEIMNASAVFKEFLSIRRDSKLFRLTTGDDVIARVGFHNIGRAQSQGLIVMSIDDGIGLPDLDPANDAIVVVVNGSDVEQSHTVSTAAGFTLHPTLAASADARVTTASFSEGADEGTFTVPAKTMAVFVKAQGADQGEGLSALATVGAPDVVPYADTTVFVRGDMNGWGEANPFEYKGDGVYQSRIELTADTTYGFKVASADWSTVDFGAVGGEEVVVQDADQTLTRSGANLSFTPTVTAIYIFEIDAGDTEAPVLNVSEATTVYVRGGMNGWGEVDAMTYLGNDRYSVVINIPATGEQEFKIASADWSTVDFGSAEADAGVTEGVLELLAVSGSNMTMDFTEAGDYTFLFDMSDASAPTLGVHKTQMFDDTTVFLRGSMNGWGEDDEMVYLGGSIYSADIVLTAGSYEFKVASSDWSTVDFGATGGEEAVTVGAGEQILVPSGANMTIEIATDGIYRFEIGGPDNTAPSFEVSEVLL